MSTTGGSFQLFLQVSFFKSQPYRVSVKDGEIHFTCIEQEDQSFSIALDQVKNVFVYGRPPREVEIRTNDKTIYGKFSSKKNATRAIEILKNVFGDRFVEIHS